MKMLAVLLFTLICLGNARFIHVHRESDGKGNKMLKDADLREINDEALIDVIRNIKPTRFVPLNNELFFKTYDPCKEGFKRDVLGICREVWD